MSGRGRPRKAKSPDSKLTNKIPKEKEQEPPARCLAITKEKQKETTETKKAQDKKTPNHTDEKPSARDTSKGKTINHDTVETNMPNGIFKEKSKAKARKKSAGEAENTPPDTLEEPAKKCAGRAKSPDSISAENVTRPKVKQEPPIRCQAFTEKQDEATKKQKVKNTDEKPSAHKTRKEESEETSEQHGVPAVIAKAKTCSTKSKTREKPAGEAENAPLDTPKDTAKNFKGAKHADNAKLPDSAEKATAPLENLEGNTETRGGKTKAAQALAEEKVSSILEKTLNNLKIKTKEKANASKAVNEIIKCIIDHLKRTESFKNVKEPLRTGSYYENLKISNPDEFDVMLPIPADRVQIDPFGDDGAFYSVALKRGNNPLKKFQEGDVLPASEMLHEFREEVKKCVKKFPDWSMDRKIKGCPAVTMTRKEESTTISLDVVLCLEVKSSWPQYTKDGFNIEKWLGTKVKQEYKRQPYYLVPKYEGNGRKEKDGVFAKDVWRISFSHVEKAILKNHGSEKTCCEREGKSCCRKACLKLLKNLLHLLKEKNKTKFDKFCSYHAKTTLLHACCSRPKDTDWMASDLNRCFQLLLQDFDDHLKEAQLNNFFLPSQNLLSGPSNKMCIELADCIKEQREKGFPIFEEELRKLAA